MARQTSPFPSTPSAGYYPGKDLDAIPAELLGYVELGHTLVKIKIGGASLDKARAGSRRRLRS
jgi:D(-)-tartrate dehydratase